MVGGWRSLVQKYNQVSSTLLMVVFLKFVFCIRSERDKHWMEAGRRQRNQRVTETWRLPAILQYYEERLCSCRNRHNVRDDHAVVDFVMWNKIKASRKNTNPHSSINVRGAWPDHLISVLRSLLFPQVVLRFHLMGSYICACWFLMRMSFFCTGRKGSWDSDFFNITVEAPSMSKLWPPGQMRPARNLITLIH